MPMPSHLTDTVAVPRAALAAVVNYDYATEEADYYAQLPEDREGHVFTHLHALHIVLTEYLHHGDTDSPHHPDHGTDRAAF